MSAPRITCAVFVAGTVAEVVAVRARSMKRTN